MKYGLKESDLVCLAECFKKFGEIEEVILFGSRAKGNYKNGSDVDLAVRGEKISDKTISRLSWLLNEELPLPYYFDIIDYGKINAPELKAHIDRVGIVIYSADAGKESQPTDRG